MKLVILFAVLATCLKACLAADVTEQPSCPILSINNGGQMQIVNQDSEAQCSGCALAMKHAESYDGSAACNVADYGDLLNQASPLFKMGAKKQWVCSAVEQANTHWNDFRLGLSDSLKQFFAETLAAIVDKEAKKPADGAVDDFVSENWEGSLGMAVYSCSTCKAEGCCMDVALPQLKSAFWPIVEQSPEFESDASLKTVVIKAMERTCAEVNVGSFVQNLKDKENEDRAMKEQKEREDREREERLRATLEQAELRAAEEQKAAEEQARRDAEVARLEEARIAREKEEAALMEKAKLLEAEKVKADEAKRAEIAREEARLEQERIKRQEAERAELARIAEIREAERVEAERRLEAEHAKQAELAKQAETARDELSHVGLGKVEDMAIDDEIDVGHAYVEKRYIAPDTYYIFKPKGNAHNIRFAGLSTRSPLAFKKASQVYGNYNPHYSRANEEYIRGIRPQLLTMVGFKSVKCSVVGHTSAIKGWERDVWNYADRNHIKNWCQNTALFNHIHDNSDIGYLSEKRAQAVASYLNKDGPIVIHLPSFGASAYYPTQGAVCKNPKFPQSVPEVNRRVDVVCTTGGKISAAQYQQLFEHCSCPSHLRGKK